MAEDLRIFISYRRSDSRGYVGWLSSTIELQLPKARIFRDVESIGMGDWKRSIDEGIRLSDIVLVVIGDQWVSVSEEGSGRRRLDDPEDMVRWEVARALECKAPHGCVAQILLDDALPLAERELPEELRRLCDMQAFRLRYEDWQGNVSNLVEHLREPRFRRPAKLKGEQILERWRAGHESPLWVGCQGGESVFLSLKKDDLLQRNYEVQYAGEQKNKNWFHVRLFERMDSG